MEQGKQAPAVQEMLDPKVSVEYLAYAELNEDLVLFCEDENSLSYAEQLHRKVSYFTNILNVNYGTALHIINQ
ncbi:hypothetical protein [Aggregatibacter actinomycetemcomitans]|uniref:hypothetical protein n=1 Tax=Aggregatibacter actinomycetemcomitans TaxID=714 RepID=UPI001F1224B6|nr:hypothetical protein [Aggregatibacter actinomycetemcomitans]